MQSHCLLFLYLNDFLKSRVAFKCFSIWISLICNFEFTKLIRDKVFLIELSQFEMPWYYDVLRLEFAL